MASFQSLLKLAESENMTGDAKYYSDTWNTHLPMVRSFSFRFSQNSAKDDESDDEEEEDVGFGDGDGEDSQLKRFLRKRKLYELPVAKGKNISETTKWENAVVPVNLSATKPNHEYRQYYRRDGLRYSLSSEKSIDFENDTSVPYINWEDEVLLSMNEEVPDESNEGKYITKNDRESSRVFCVAIPPISKNVVPFECFDTEFVNVESTKDALAELILPPPSPDYTLSPMVQSPCPSPVNVVGSAEKSKKDAAEEKEKEKEKELIDPLDFEDDESRERREKMERDRIKKLEKAKRLQRVDSTLKIMTSTAAFQSSADAAAKRIKENAAKVIKGKMSIAAVNHSSIALAHRNTKPDLSELELRYFHRPRMGKEREKNLVVQVASASASVPSSGQTTNKNGDSATSSNSSTASSLVPMSMRHMAHFSESDKQNLSLAGPSGGRCNFILLEYIEEFPPVMLNYGMASAIFNYYRPPASTADKEEEESSRGKIQSAGSQGAGALSDIKGKARLPRHVSLLLQQRTQKQGYEQDDGSIPKLSIGETKVLSSDAGEEPESPFLGTIEPDGKEIQQAIVNNLFRAPIFRHSPHPTDFLLIKTKVLGKQLVYSIREIPYLFLCGQLEPQQIVPRPMAKINPLQEKFYLLSAARYLQTNFDGVDFSDLMNSILRYW